MLSRVVDGREGGESCSEQRDEQEMRRREASEARRWDERRNAFRRRKSTLLSIF